MKRLAAFGLCVALCISLTACRFVDLEPEEFLQKLEEAAQWLGQTQLTRDENLLGTRTTSDGDSFVGQYTADCTEATGRDVVFGGASTQARTIRVYGVIETEAGEAKVQIRRNATVEEYEPDEHGGLELVLDLSGGGNYIMVCYDSFSGTVELHAEYLE